jgi:tetratricopeptide (TPR) repeat protein
MAFNKAKTLEAAQKFLAAGKVPQAIGEYQQVLRAEPEDQVTLMTVGDLYVRVGDIQQAMVYFEKLAQIFVSDGFISKSIAIYKKIAKLAPEEVMPLERLAELYVQQGVMSEARPIYLQLAEAHLKNNRTQPAIEILKKLLDLAPDNLRVQQRLAELYQAIGQDKEAASAFVATAQRHLDKGENADALKMAEKAVQADAKSAAAAAMKARGLAAVGRQKDAVDLLSKLPPSMLVPETSVLLTELYLQTGKTEDAYKLARSAFEEGPHKYGLVFGVVNGLLAGGETERGLMLLGEIRQGVVQSGESERLVSALQSAVGRLPGRMEPIEWLADVYRATGDPFHLPEALGALADAAIFAGDLPKAKQALEELVEKDPENENHRQRLRDVCEKMGVEPSEAHVVAEAEVEAEPVDAVPAEEAKLDDETEAFIAQSLTDVDLFSSYGLTQKGIDLLETVLKRVPAHTGTLEKLLDLYLGAGNERRTAELAGTLEQLYARKGDAPNAEKFAELRRRFQRAAGRTEEAAAPAPSKEFAVPVETLPPAPEPALVAAEEVAVVDAAPAGEVQEVDLSAEWAMMTEQPAAPEPPPPPPAEPPAFEEIPLEVEVAAEIPAEPAPPPPPPPPVAAAPPPPPPAPEPEPEPEAVSYDFTVDTVTDEPAPLPPPPVEEVPPASAAAQMFSEVAAEIPPAPEPAPPAAEPEAIEYEFEAPSGKAEEAPAEEPAAAPMSSAQFLSELTEEIGEFTIAPAKEVAPAKPAKGKPEKAEKTAKPEKGKPPKPAEKKASDQLRDVFNEFKADMGEVAEAEEEGEDLETHYNLGIAYREMGLLEEAIGEFQKVAKAMQSGRPFKYSMQCYTLLGLTFMDKGQPKISAIWYEKALKTPDLDPESVMAVRYDLGLAQDLAGDYKAALDSFSQVYAMNIDYRDVGDRIAELHKRV